MSDQAIHEVLVTGAHTSLGRAIASALAGDPAVRRVLCVHAPGHDLPPSSANMRHVAADLTRYREMRDVLLGEGARPVDVVVHVLAAEKIRKGLHNNAVPAAAATQRLLLAAEEHPRVARFVMVGSADVYRIDSSEPVLVGEDHPLELSAEATAAVRERVETDLVACARIGVSPLSIAVLRCAEILVPDGNGQLHDYLRSRVCLRPLGYDPMLNVLALEDAAEAVRLAVHSSARGVFNVPGFDSLPLSELIHAAGRIGLALPGPLLAPLYGLRAMTTAFRFRYAGERKRFHFGAIPNGRRAREVLGYEPAHRLRLDVPGRA